MIMMKINMIMRFSMIRIIRTRMKMAMIIKMLMIVLKVIVKTSQAHTWTSLVPAADTEYWPSTWPLTGCGPGQGRRGRAAGSCCPWWW